MANEWETAFTKQGTVITEINQLFSNTKKDSQERKTEAYIAKRKQTLNLLNDQFEKNHEILMKEKEKLKNTDYYDKHYHQTIKLISSFKDLLNKYSNDLNKPIDPITGDQQTLQKQHSPAELEFNAQIERSLDVIAWVSNDDIDSNHVIDFHVNNLLEALKEINKGYSKLTTLNNHTMDEIMQTRYIETKHTLQEVMTALVKQKSEISKVKREIKLPKLQIPTFTGKWQEWTPFHDIFKKIIHEYTDLCNAEKLQYLKSHLKESAAQLIGHLDISEANYDTAWKMLKERYDNKRKLVDARIDNILMLPKLEYESAELLRKIHDTTKECLYAINNLGINTGEWAPIIVNILLKKLDKESRRLFEQNLQQPKEIPTIEAFCKFIQTRFESLEVIEETRSGQQGRRWMRQSMEDFKPKHGFTNRTFENCQYCNQQHIIFQCQDFQRQTVQQREEFVKRNNLCYNCLTHSNENKCMSKRVCMICRRNHHTLLHKYNEKPKSDQEIQSYYCERNRTVLLATAIVKVQTVSGHYELLRVLLDSGSQASFMTEEASQLLAIPKKKTYAEIHGINSTKPTTVRSKISVQIKPRFESSFEMNVDMLILPTLKKVLPVQEITQNKYISKNFRLADPLYYKPARIDAILGAEVHSKLILNGVYKTKDELSAQHTKLGWTVYGNTERAEHSCKIVSMVSCTKLERQLRKFWEVEEIPADDTNLTEEENRCELLYINNYKRNSDGTYTVRLPIKENAVLGESKKQATARLHQIERLLKKKPELEMEYKKFMDEYIKLGHMRRVPIESKLAKEAYYLPHHAVIKKDSTTTKVRVVFDASAKTSNGKCLNDILMVGPKIQDDISNILLRWRKHKIVFTADIEKMYRQIKVAEADRNYQRIMWRSSENEAIQEYELATVTYGTAAAPFLAVRTLQQLAKDEEHRFPAAANVILRDCYVDDIISGTDNYNEAMEIQRQLNDLLKSGGMTLRKWTSNYQELLKGIPEQVREKDILNFTDDDTIKTLGIHWSPITDVFSFNVTLKQHNSTLTKRQLLANIAKIYDPLGWLTPVTIKAKLLLQDVWRKNVNWDAKLDEAIIKKWKHFSETLMAIEEIKIPRYIKQDPGNQVELHGFSDASENAYSAVVYCRTINIKNTVSVRLIAAKAKVSPIKSKLTIPKLELCGAVLLAKLMKSIKKNLNVSNNIFLWTDSMVTLGWIRSPSRKLPAFIANRVRQIENESMGAQWNYVKSLENPADVASRGIDADKLKHHSLWWNGPQWLAESKESWPRCEEKVSMDNKDEQNITNLWINITDENDIYDRFSRMHRLRNVIALCYRFTNQCRKIKCQPNHLSFDEIKKAENAAIKWTQLKYFRREIEDLKRKGEVNHNSTVLQLNPYLDSDAIMRVGGRLQHSNLSYNERHPIIIPHKAHLTQLLIDEAHAKTLHGGNEMTIRYLKQKYWIINVKTLVKKYIYGCVRCARFNRANNKQLMGQLPAERVIQSAPFTHCGVDYAGPIQIRMSKGRGAKSYKGYIAVFVCFATKAIHIEAVTDLTTDGFLAAFKRFTARRGLCSHIYSDCGTNFIGAAKVLQNDLETLLRETTVAVSKLLEKDGIKWHFNPPSAPHMGGLWEAGVKSIKYHLRRTIGDTTLTYEEITTVLYQIEAALNSRPLYPTSNHPSDFNVLTPGHFLIGKAMVSPPEPQDELDEVTPLSRWKLLRKIRNDFWKKWSHEYLGRLQTRPKWHREKRDLAKNDLVVLREDNMPATKWMMARVEEIHPGKDGITRVVTLRLPHGAILKRPIVKISKLPVDQQTEETDDTESDVEMNNVTITRKPSRFELSGLLMILLLLIMTVKQGATEYNVTQLQPGLYVEHLGQLRIHRGILRVEVKTAAKVKDDAIFVQTHVDKIENLCKEVQQFSSEAPCRHFMTYLNQKRDEILKEIEIVRNGSASRTKRGYFGKILQTVFGVNDEVYTDIKALQTNQQTLLQTTQQQTKLLLSTTTIMKESEHDTQQKLIDFNKRLDKVKTELNNQRAWFAVVDETKLNLNLLMAYNVVCNMLEELQELYGFILAAFLGRGNLLDFINPRELTTLIHEVSPYIPAQLMILPTPLKQLDIMLVESEIRIYGFFEISTKGILDLIKAHPVPLSVGDHQYSIPDIGKDLIAVNYNEQIYIELSEIELDKCKKTKSVDFLCSTTVMNNIGQRPNCIIDELYHRYSGQQCAIKMITLEGLTWKNLYKGNTWMFVADTTTSAAIKCRGNHEDIILNGTGIIHITGDCIIKTSLNTLVPEIIRQTTVKQTFNHPLPLNITSATRHIKGANKASEPVLRVTDSFENIRIQEDQLNTITAQGQWINLMTRHIIISIIYFIITIGIIVTLYQWKFGKKRRHTQATENLEVSEELRIMIPEELVVAASSEGENVHASIMNMATTPGQSPKGRMVSQEPIPRRNRS